MDPQMNEIGMRHDRGRLAAGERPRQQRMTRGPVEHGDKPCRNSIRARLKETAPFAARHMRGCSAARIFEFHGGRPPGIVPLSEVSGKDGLVQSNIGLYPNSKN